MKQLELQQGSPEWLAARTTRFCASEASAMMGASPKTSRTELLRLKSTGDEQEFSRWTQENLLDKGLKAEARARPMIEAIIGEEMYPVVAVSDCGTYLASYDGLSMDEKTAHEHKVWNKTLVQDIDRGELRPEYYWQLEHQALVGDLERIIFVCSDGGDNLVHMEYRPVPGRREQLIAGWAQFAEDLRDFKHVEVLPAPAATAIVALPALSVQLVGEVKSSNLPAFQASATKLIASINTDLQTDQDFADAEAAIKWCAQGETDLETVKRIALSQTASIDELFRTIDVLSEQMRQKRLALDKLVKSRKESLRDEIRREGSIAFAKHIAALNARLGENYMPTVPVDFAAVMKGKKTIASLRNAVNTELAHGKIAANAIADKIDINMQLLATHAEYGHLFRDAAALVLKEADDFAAAVQIRIAEHKAKEEQRIELERERIRARVEAEERAKIHAEEQAKATAEQRAREAERAASHIIMREADGNDPFQAKVGDQKALRAIEHLNTKTAQGFAVPIRKEKPSDQDILTVLARHYIVPESKALEWLVDMDLVALAQELEISI